MLRMDEALGCRPCQCPPNTGNVPQVEVGCLADTDDLPLHVHALIKQHTQVADTRRWNNACIADLNVLTSDVVPESGRTEDDTLSLTVIKLEHINQHPVLDLT